MKSIGIFYGSTSGKTTAVAEEIDFYLRKEEHELFNVAEGIDEMKNFDNLILITPTYGVGELQRDWANVLPEFEKIDFTGKKVGIIGLGNQYAFGESFVGGMRILYDIVLKNGGEIIGLTPDTGYHYEESSAVIDGQFVGLALDEANQDDLTPDRIANWIQDIKKAAL